MRTVICCLFAMLLLGCTAFPPAAHADEWNQLTRFTFSQPVEVPGRILPAGTYWFQLLESQANRQIVLIYNADQSKIESIALTAADWRYDTTNRTDLTFAERRHDKPEALLTWYYPGQEIGHEFLYPGRLEARFDHDAKQNILVPALIPRESSGSSTYRSGE
jgi:hypothetical protein